MSSVFCFRDFVTERLAAAAEEIQCVFAKAVLGYEEEIERQRRLLDAVLKPVIKLHKRKITQLSICHEEVLAENQVCDQESISGLGQEDPDPPWIKEELEELHTSEGEQGADAFISRPIHAVMDPTLLSETLTNISITAIKSESDRGGSGLSRNSHQDWSNDRKPEDTCFRCPFCTDEFCDPLKLKVHARAHISEKSHKSGVTCGKGFARKALERKHARIHAGATPHGCPVCGKEFNCRSNRTAHMRTHAGEKRHACATCGKGFSRGVDLRRHHRTHTGEKLYSCVYCGKGFPYHSSLKNHVRVHTGEKPYKCALCGKGFAVRTTLKIHTRVHTGEKPYTCGVCGKTFAHGTGLRIHRRIHTREETQSATLKV
ncbi:zinc finger protein 239-like isoform X2 [Pseudoliparis swirei]|uniref:zinc finger protein 239-like isoform X2 n=1 Tax=Pseudoliparis swirei TaxID=2059687 RepID=UPI0024BE2DEB|nr:zinc finger protein 239-like isoform X2 [Pseudoliparis swirei]